MKITKIRVKNFRLLQDITLNLKDDLSLLIGKNNSGKTSLIVILEKFFESEKFDLNDYPVCQRENILNINNDTPVQDLAIQLFVQIKYGVEDDLSQLSELILDIDESIDTVNLLFECNVDKAGLLKQLAETNDKARYIAKNLEKHMKCKFYVFEDDRNLDLLDRTGLIEKSARILKEIVNLQIIHAKRNVSSSEEVQKGVKLLSSLTTKFFNSNSDSTEKVFSKINDQMSAMDEAMNATYSEVFDPFLKNAKNFLGLGNLKVISDIQSNELLAYASRVVYGDAENILPEHLNGLGVMNILFLLLQIEMRKDKIAKDEKPLNILIIEEPEAHTHPQMQYVFASQIKVIIGGIKNLQTVLTTHSSHIVSQCDFKDIRYLQKIDNDNVKIKDFFVELQHSYDDKQQFNFLIKYLTLQSSELFFADKIIFIEGTTEKILLPYFMGLFDEKNDDLNAIKLGAQHISIMEVGANARVFGPFLEFLGIKTLVITDIDSTEAIKKPNKKGDGEVTSYEACPVEKSTHTSNYTIKHFYSAPAIEDPDFHDWYKQVKDNKAAKEDSRIRVAYQIEEDGYHARSFEDAFLHINKKMVEEHIDQLSGLKNKSKFDSADISTYDLTNEVIDKKSDFASSLLYLALAADNEKKIEWKAPNYINEALLWLSK